MSAKPRNPSVGIVLYAPNGDKSAVLATFAGALKQRGWRVAGIIIETRWSGEAFAPGSVKTGLDLLDLATGERLPLARADTDGLAIGRWVLDQTVLATATERLEAAAHTDCDVVIVDKFGPLEGRGGGFAPALSKILRAKKPLLVAVRSEFLEVWDEFAAPLMTDQAALLRPTVNDLNRWWGPERLAEELIRGTPADPAETVVFGLNWILVAGPNGVGLCHAPAAAALPAGGCRPVETAGPLIGQPLSDLARHAAGYDPMLRALGWAAINAHLNQPSLLSAPDGTEEDGLAALLGGSDPENLVVIGGFPGTATTYPQAEIVEFRPSATEFPAWAGGQRLTQASHAAITASTLGNGSAPPLLSAAWSAKTAIVGPGTPLSSLLFNYGVDCLSGFVVEDRDAASAAVQHGGHIKALKAAGRKWTLKKPLSQP